MFTKMFWRAAMERAIKSAAQGAIGGTTAGVVGVFKDLHTAEAAGIAAAGMFLLSILTSLASAATTDGNPSVGSSEVLAQPGNTADPAGGTPVEVEAAAQPAADANVPRDVTPTRAQVDTTAATTDDTMPVAQPFQEAATSSEMPPLPDQSTDLDTTELPAPDPA